MSNSWSYAYASCIGTSHLKLGSRKDDVCRATVSSAYSNIFIGIICDGAGSAKWGGAGAWITASAIYRNCHAYFNNERSFPDDRIIWNWIDEARDKIFRVSTSRSAQLNDFATTLILTMSDGNNSLVAHIGDGGVVIQSEETKEWQCLSFPEHGEYASTTRFITEDETPDLRINRIDSCISSLFLFSDGIERLALDFKTREPFSPFFNQMVQPLQINSGCGHLNNLSKSLKNYLNSDTINSRTDDDKSLIIASFTRK
jgi:serine/threonine protein phosphatase PrpC